MDGKEWKETGLTGKIRDVIVDVNTPYLSIATGCPYSRTSYSKSWEGTVISTAEVDVILYGTPETVNKKAP